MATLRAYQETAAAIMLKRPRFLLADPAGAGKTPTTLAALRRSGASRVLVVCPNGAGSIPTQWMDEAAIWWPEARFVLGTGSPEKRYKARAAVGATNGHPQGLVVTYDALRSDVGRLALRKWDCLVLDEAHHIKSRRALQTRAAWQLSKNIGGLWELTASIFRNRPDELWSLLYALDRRRWPHHWPWVRQYMFTTMTMRGPRGKRTLVEEVAPWKDEKGEWRWLKPGVEKQIHDEVASVSLYRTLDEVLPELPNATPIPLTVELDPDERKAYSELLKRNWTQLEDGQVIQSVNKVSQETRLRQVVSGMEAFSADRPRMGSKLRAAYEKVCDLDPEQVVVLTWSRSAAERLARETAGALIHGGVAKEDRRAALSNFRTGKVRVLVGTLATLGEGVDGLQVAQHLVLVDRPWSPEDEAQTIGRLRRSGQQKPVFFYTLTARSTIDEKINAILKSKRRVIDAVRLGEFES